MKPFRIGVIGAGFMGRHHAHVAADMPGVELVGVADVDETAARALASATGTRAYPSVRQLLEKESPDAVIVATPEHLHREPALEAAEAGCHLLVEKPIAHTLEDADAIIQACERHGVHLAVAYILRHEIAYAKLKEAVESQSLGRLLSIYARRNIPLSAGLRLAHRTSVIQYLAVHDLDQVVWYHSRPVKSVVARPVKGQIFQRYGTPDGAWLMYELEDSVTAVLECGWYLPDAWGHWTQPGSWSRTGDYRMELMGTEGIAGIDLRTQNLTACDGDGWKFPDTRLWPSLHGRRVGAIRYQLEHFVSSVRNGQAPLVSGREARQSLLMALMAERAVETGQLVRPEDVEP